MTGQHGRRKGGPSVERSREAARKLEQVCALAMALPAKDPGPLTYPPFRELLKR